MSKTITLEYGEGVPFHRVIKDLAALASNRDYDTALQSIDTEIVSNGRDDQPSTVRLRVELA